MIQRSVPHGEIEEIVSRLRGKPPIKRPLHSAPCLHKSQASLVETNLSISKTPYLKDQNADCLRILQERAEYKASLAESLQQRKQAEDSIVSLRNELKEVQHQLTQSIQRCEAQAVQEHATQNQIDILKQTLTEERHSKGMLEQSMATMQHHIDTLRAELERGEKMREELSTALHAAQHQSEVEAMRVQEADEVLANKLRLIAELQESALAAEEQQLQAGQEREALLQALAQREQQNARDIETLSSLQTEVIQLRQQLEQAQTQAHALRQEAEAGSCHQAVLRQVRSHVEALSSLFGPPQPLVSLYALLGNFIAQQGKEGRYDTTTEQPPTG